MHRFNSDAVSCSDQEEPAALIDPHRAPATPHPGRGLGGAHLHGDVEPRNVEGLEHDLGRVLSVLRCVERRLRLPERDRRPSVSTQTILDSYSVTNSGGFSHTAARAVEASYQQEVVVLRLGPQVLEDDLLHEALHQVPVLHDSVTNWPLLQLGVIVSITYYLMHLNAS